MAKKRTAQPEPAPRGPGRERDPRPDTLAGRLGARIESLRKARQLKVEDLAALTDGAVGKSTIIEVEGGRTEPRIGTVIAIARALKVSIDDLVSGRRTDE